MNKIYDKINCGIKEKYLLKNGKYYNIRTGCWSCLQARKPGYLEWLETLKIFGLKKVIEKEQALQMIAKKKRKLRVKG